MLAEVLPSVHVESRVLIISTTATGIASFSYVVLMTLTHGLFHKLMVIILLSLLLRQKRTYSGLVVIVVVAIL